MKNYSDYTITYVQDICNALNNQGIKMPRYKTEFSPEYFKTLTELIEDYITYHHDLYYILDNQGLVNRGYCPFTGDKIDNSFPNYSYMGRIVYVSHKGYSIMKAESDEKYEQVMGRPRQNTQSSSNINSSKGCYIATVCYNDENAFEVKTLKYYRDNVLVKSIFGRLFVKFYYTVSPFIAKKMKNTKRLNNFIKKHLLNKIVRKINRK